MAQPSDRARIDYHQASFSISASTVDQCPPEAVAEVAFMGRSNAGKSSAINVLTGQTKLARTSKTPGRTQLLNFFQLSPHRYLVDLPGFGYAKVSPEQKRKWQKQLERYLEKRTALKGLIMLMDIRHPFKEFDEVMLQWCIDSEMPLHILMTKSDKLGSGAARSALLQATKRLAEHNALVSVQLFSSLLTQGVEELQAKLDSWLLPEDEKNGDAILA